MKLINSSYEIVEPKSYSLEDVYKHIELCGRVCYKSEDKMTPDSATKFVDRMIKSAHMSTLEHGTVYLYREFELPAQNTTTSGEYNVEYYTWAQPYKDNPYSVVSILYRKDGIAQVYVTTNYRVIVENALEDDLQYIVDQPMDHHERSIQYDLLWIESDLNHFVDIVTLVLARKVLDIVTTLRINSIMRLLLSYRVG